jgi:hypothetical protein
MRPARLPVVDGGADALTCLPLNAHDAVVAAALRVG